MNKRLDALRNKYKEEMPTTFTDQDKQEILTKIKQGEEREPRVRRFFPRVLTAVMLTLVFVIGGYLLADQVFYDGQLNRGTHDELTEEDISEMFEDPAVRETVFGDDAEITAAEHINNAIYSVETETTRFLIKIHGDKSMEIFKLTGYARDFDEDNKQGEEYIKSSLKYAIDRKISLGDEADISQIKHLEGPLYRLETANNHFLITLDSERKKETYAMDVYAFKKSVSYPVEVEVPDETDEHSTFLDESAQYTTFDPETIQVGDTIGNSEVTNVEKGGDQVTVTFDVKSRISGDIFDEGKLVYVPDNPSLSEIPFAAADIGKHVHFDFKLDERVKSMMEGTEPIGGDSTYQGILVIEVTYHYESDGSTITLSTEGIIGPDPIDTYPSEKYQTTIELSEELRDIYSDYAKTLDDSLLEDLKPIDVFRLYWHATYTEDHDAVYALYIQDDAYYIPDKEAYLEDLETDNDVLEKNTQEYYERLETVDTFHEIYASEEETNIAFNTGKSAVDDYFTLIKDMDLGVWKVSWLPIQ